MTAPLTLGAAASAAWMEEVGLTPGDHPHWFVEVALESGEPTIRFELNIYPQEWGFVLRVGRKVSSIRVTDVAFVHGSDDYQLLERTPALADIPNFLISLERKLSVRFLRMRAVVKSNLMRASAIVRPWLEFA